MMKKTMILADKDEMYLNNLANYFMEKAPQLELITFTKSDKLAEYLGRGNAADILAIDETMAKETIKAESCNAVRIVLSVSMSPMNGYELVKKYQKSESLLNKILLKYAEQTGTAEVIKGKSNTKVIAFYSPAGGSGKTTLALALATAAAKVGMHVFYLNLEGVDSIRDTLAPTSGSMSDVLLAMKTKGMKADIKLAASAAKEPNGGFYYLSGVESISEYDEISGEEIGHLVGTVRDLAEHDLLILDLDAGFSVKTQKILECADVIFVPVVSNTASVAKVRRFLRESELHSLYDGLQSKMRLVVNHASPKGVGEEIQSSGLLTQMPCSAMIAVSPIFTKWKDLLRAGDTMLPVMQPLLQAVKES